MTPQSPESPCIVRLTGYILNSYDRTSPVEHYPVVISVGYVRDVSSQKAALQDPTRAHSAGSVATLTLQYDTNTGEVCITRNPLDPGRVVETPRHGLLMNDEEFEFGLGLLVRHFMFMLTGATNARLGETYMLRDDLHADIYHGLRLIENSYRPSVYVDLGLFTPDRIARKIPRQKKKL